jgi:hypothetical protein
VRVNDLINIKNDNRNQDTNYNILIILDTKKKEGHYISDIKEILYPAFITYKTRIDEYKTIDNKNISMPGQFMIPEMIEPQYTQYTNNIHPLQYTKHIISAQERKWYIYENRDSSENSNYISKPNVLLVFLIFMVIMSNGNEALPKTL